MTVTQFNVYALYTLCLFEIFSGIELNNTMEHYPSFKSNVLCIMIMKYCRRMVNTHALYSRGSALKFQSRGP
jgi:hypothetical protein